MVDKELIKGGDLNNAVVIADQEVAHTKLEKVAKYFNKGKVSDEDLDALKNMDQRYDNEPARHKILDLLGDIYLLGSSYKGTHNCQTTRTSCKHFFCKGIEQEINAKISVVLLW